VPLLHSPVLLYPCSRIS